MIATRTVGSLLHKHQNHLSQRDGDTPTRIVSNTGIYTLTWHPRMGLLHQKEGIEKSTNKRGGCVFEDVRRCPHINCKSSVVQPRIGTHDDPCFKFTNQFPAVRPWQLSDNTLSH